MTDIDFDQETIGHASRCTRDEMIAEAYSGLSLRASITVKASAAPPFAVGIWFPA
jgi:hypothetical protein